MKLEEHIFRAVNAAEKNDIELALLHACIAIDASSRKYFKADKSGRDNYQKFIRKYYWILEPMMGAKVKLAGKKWENISMPKPSGGEEPKKDIASIIYTDFRCPQVHGSEISPIYKICQHNTDEELHYKILNGLLYLPERTIWGLIAICVFAEINKDISTQTKQYIRLSGNYFAISDWWGLENSFKTIAEKHNPTR